MLRCDDVMSHVICISNLQTRSAPAFPYRLAVLRLSCETCDGAKDPMALI